MTTWVNNLTAREGSEKEHRSAADPYRSDFLPVSLQYLKELMGHRAGLGLINDLGKDTLYVFVYLF